RNPQNPSSFLGATPPRLSSAPSLLVVLMSSSHHRATFLLVTPSLVEPKTQKSPLRQSSHSSRRCTGLVGAALLFPPLHSAILFVEIVPLSAPTLVPPLALPSSGLPSLL
ncbi:hypothetical protein PIB30_078066, partial [Stylosanthes scabra]|nr:hypothetical protein [Stylosanthes scabra]